jgi:trans-aconitate methyltransferase
VNGATTTMTRNRQRWSPESYDRNARFVPELGVVIVDWLDPRPDERILDLGCGDGALTARLAAAGAKVTGVDASPELLAVAAGRGLDVRLMDGDKLGFDGEFDAVFSNAALHWMRDAPAVLRGIARALVPGGRFVAEFGGHGNVAALTTAMRYAALRHDGDPALAQPWFFPSADEYASLLESEGFEIVRIGLFPRPTSLPTGLRGWLTTFNTPYFEQYEAEARVRVLDEIEEMLAPALRDGDGEWTADYVRVRVAARWRQ